MTDTDDTKNTLDREAKKTDRDDTKNTLDREAKRTDRDDTKNHTGQRPRRRTETTLRTTLDRGQEDGHRRH